MRVYMKFFFYQSRLKSASKVVAQNVQNIHYFCLRPSLILSANQSRIQSVDVHNFQ